MSDENRELLAAAAYATRAAAKLLAGARPAEIRSKGNPRDLVTEWDVRSEECIRVALEERTPGVTVLGEEGGGADGVPGQLRWVVDPIDGTVNFAHGLPMWTVSIACERVGEGPLAGVVFAPLLGWWFEASKGGGARDGDGKPLQVSAQPVFERAMLASGFPYDLPTNPDNNLDAWEHMQRKTGACRRLGSASLDLCLVARGWFDGYWEGRLKAWDIAAGALVVAEAGGTVTDLHGGPYDAHKGEVAATNGAIHEVLLAELASVKRRP